MRVVHLACTPLAGSPIRIVHALREHTDWEARLVVLDPAAYGTRVFDDDMVWERDKEEAMACIRDADILHFHHYFELDANPFGLDFTRMGRNKIFVRQFHSSPLHIAAGDKSVMGAIINSSVPQLVIAQYPERYFPRAYIVPNLVPLDAPLYQPLRKPMHARGATVFFAPSSRYSAWEFADPWGRWASKGAPETLALLKRLAQRLPDMGVDVRQDVPHIECLHARRDADISIDEMVSGSYHLSSLESLAQGIPTLAFLDGRTIDTLARFTGSSDLPWFNCRLEKATDILEALVMDPDLRKTSGDASRAWMEKYWSDRQLIRHYQDAYKTLLESGGAPFPLRFDVTSRRDRWHARTQYDLAWKIRRWYQSAKSNRLLS